MKQKKQTHSTTASDVIRYIFLAWLIAALVEFMLLPKELQGMEHLKGIAAMSFPRLLLVTAGGALALWGISLHLPVNIFLRWATVAIFGLLATLTLTASFHTAFLVICL